MHEWIEKVKYSNSYRLNIWVKLEAYWINTNKLDATHQKFKLRPKPASVCVFQLILSFLLYKEKKIAKEWKRNSFITWPSFINFLKTKPILFHLEPQSFLPEIKCQAMTREDNTPNVCHPLTYVNDQRTTTTWLTIGAWSFYFLPIVISRSREVPTIMHKWCVDTTTARDMPIACTSPTTPETDALERAKWLVKTRSMANFYYDFPKVMMAL